MFDRIKAAGDVRETCMNLRTNTTTVIFTRAFVLRGVDGSQPPGRYTIETDERLLPTMLTTAYQRVATWIWLPAGCGNAGAAMGFCQALAINPADLKTALSKDVMPE